MRQRSLAKSTRSAKAMFCGRVESQYLVGSFSPFGHSISSHSSARSSARHSSRCAARTRRRAPWMARLPPPRHDVHRRLWVSDCRAGDDSPLSKPFRQDVPETCRSQRLSTPRRRRCGPNAMSRTRSPPCAAASSPPSSKRCRDAHAAQHRSSDDHDRKICDAVRIELDPNNPDRYVSRAESENNSHQHDKAIADYSRAIELDPNNPDWYVSRADSKDNNNQHDKAIADYSRAIELDPKNPDYLGLRADSRIAHNEYGKALADFTESIRLAPDRAGGYLRRGDVYLKVGQFDQAGEDYDRAVAVDPTATGGRDLLLQLRRAIAICDGSLDVSSINTGFAPPPAPDPWNGTAPPIRALRLGVAAKSCRPIFMIIKSRTTS